ncbi:MAG: zf-HC2 domain-containing protein [Deltaproteobacteria bacterium]|jgi:hypothetical protein|nr:zf-HC2 domain-containing protein [Deltaproteobacteria bacterium]
MDCSEIKKRIPEFLDAQLDPDEHQRVQSHLETCTECGREARAIQRAWELVGELDDIQPDPNFETRFWARIAEQTSWQDKFFGEIRALFLNRRLLPALAAAGLILCISVVATYKYLQTSQSDNFMVEFSGADLDMVDNIELVENLDLIRDLDLLSDLEIIEDLDDMDAS